LTAVQINLFCDDVEKAAQFYAALGFPVVFRAPRAGTAEHIEVEAAGTRIGLTSANAANRIAGLGVVAPAAASAELVFWCHDVDLMYEAAVNAGAAELAAPRDSPDGRIRYGWVRDPQSHQLKFVAPL
jgi:catechol 2,3-dioxygenase-like lactoylglutathione lyase family enzyme